MITTRISTNVRFLECTLRPQPFPGHNGARTSIDSAAMVDYRPSDIQLNFLNNASNLASVTSVSEVVIVPSNLQSSGGSSQVGASDNGLGQGSVAAPSAGAPSGSGGIHHPHHRHHRPYSAFARGSATSTTSAVTGSSTISHSTMFTDIP